MRAMTCPFFTSALKSASTSRICPDTWELTCTCTVAASVPEAATVAVSVPRSTLAVRSWG